jgi:hypothetical protein
MMLSDADLLEEIQSFLTRHKMKPSRFGLEAMNDGALVPHLKAGRSLTLKSARRVMDYMRAAEQQRTSC